MKLNEQHETILRSAEEVALHVQEHGDLRGCTIQGVDLSDLEGDWQEGIGPSLTLMGCHIPDSVEGFLRSKGVLIFPIRSDLPYHPFRSRLYTWQELMAPARTGSGKTADLEIYEHFSRSRFNPGLQEALYQRVHDHSMDDGLRRLLRFDHCGMTALRGVGMMGGHSTLRTDEFYARTAETARLLSQAGYLVVSGGGPGIMEAANLGAYFGGRSAEELRRAIEMLAPAPSYTHPAFQSLAENVLTEFPSGESSLAIPTWFYGHEPSNVFATHIAKYFSNSLREDTLLAISLFGVVFAPGSAGTTQEIFQDAAQNHYGTYGYLSPMVFLGKKRYQEDTGIYSLLQTLSKGRPYARSLFVSDEPGEILSFLQEHPPVPA